MKNLFSDIQQKKKYEDYICKSFSLDAYNFFLTNGEEADLSLDEVKENIGFHYEIKNTEVTIYQFGENQKEKTTDYFVVPVAQFSVFKKYHVDIYDTFANTLLKNQTYFEVQTIKETYFLKEHDLTETLLKIAKENKFSGTNLIKVKEFIKNCSLFDNLQIFSEKWTTEFCYFKGEHLCLENNFKLVKKRTTKKQGVIYEKEENIFEHWVGETRLFDVEYTQNEIKNLVEIYNNTPLTKTQAKVYKLLLSSAVTNWFSHYLKDNNLVERKDAALIGLKGNAKSFIGVNTFGLFGLTKSFDKQAFVRENNLNADLKNIFPIALPRYFDEIPGFSVQMKQRKKDKANGDRIYFTKNNFEHGVDFHFDNFFECVTANDLDLQGDDFDDKQFTYEPDFFDINTVEMSKEMLQKVTRTFTNRVTDNSLKLGKYIYDYLITVDPQSILETIEIPLSRDEKQFAILQFGEKILSELDILKSVPLDKEMFVSSKLSNNSNVDSDLSRFKDCVSLYVDFLENKAGGRNVTLNNTVKEIKEIAKKKRTVETLDAGIHDFYLELSKNGIHVKYDQETDNVELVFNSKILPTIKRLSLSSFRKEFKYHSIKALQSLFEKTSNKPKNVYVISEGGGLYPKQTSGFSVPFHKIFETVEVYDMESEQNKTESNEKTLAEMTEMDDEVV